MHHFGKTVELGADPKQTREVEIQPKFPLLWQRPDSELLEHAMFPLVLHSLLRPGSGLVSRASLRSAHPYPTARREILMRLYV